MATEGKKKCRKIEKKKRQSGESCAKVEIGPGSKVKKKKNDNKKKRRPLCTAEWAAAGNENVGSLREMSLLLYGSLPRLHDFLSPQFTGLEIVSDSLGCQYFLPLSS